MVRFKMLRAAIEQARAGVPSLVDDERAQRVAQAFDIAVRVLGHLEGANTPSRLANRCPAARRAFSRLASELSREGSRAWAEHAAPVLAALGPTIEACVEAERADHEARERIAGVWKRLETEGAA